MFFIRSFWLGQLRDDTLDRKNLEVRGMEAEETEIATSQLNWLFLLCMLLAMLPFAFQALIVHFRGG